MFEFTVKNYWELWDKVNKNEISPEEWSLYCDMCLFELMELNSDVLKRLKER